MMQKDYKTLKCLNKAQKVEKQATCEHDSGFEDHGMRLSAHKITQDIPRPAKSNLRPARAMLAAILARISCNCQAPRKQSTP